MATAEDVVFRSRRGRYRYDLETSRLLLTVKKR